MHKYNNTMIHVLLRGFFDGYCRDYSLSVVAHYACLITPMASIFKPFMSKKKPV